MHALYMPTSNLLIEPICDPSQHRARQTIQTRICHLEGHHGPSIEVLIINLRDLGYAVLVICLSCGCILVFVAEPPISVSCLMSILSCHWHDFICLRFLFGIFKGRGCYFF